MRKYHLRFMLPFLIFMFACEQGKNSQISEDKKVNLANTFYNNELYNAAINEYEEYLTNYQIEDAKRANINYIIANIYFERLNNYNKALEYYLRIKYLYPQSQLQNEVGKRIVNCLERLQRSQDAQRLLEKETALKPDQVEEHKPGEVVATIGKKQITQGDLDFEIEKLPPYLQNQFTSKEKKLEFLRQKIMEDLLYDSAKRKGLDKDNEIIEGTFRAQKSLMAQKLLSDEIKSMLDINEQDIELYYQAHKDKYAEKEENGKVAAQKTLQESMQQAAQDLMQERQMQAYEKIIDRLMTAENVKIFEKRLK